MKYWLFILMLPLTVNAQQINKNEVDEFTGAKITETTFEYLVQDFNGTLAYEVKRIDSTLYLKMAVTIGMNEIFSVEQGAQFMLKLANRSVVTLYNTKYQISDHGGAYIGRFAGGNAVGVTLSFILSEENFQKLLASNVVKTRLYTTDGYHEETIKTKRAEKFRQALALLKN